MTGSFAGRKGLVAAALMLMSTGCALLQAPPTHAPTPEERGLAPMSGSEVRAVLDKARYRWQAAQGAAGTAITSGDGRVRVIWETGATNGRMRFTDTGYCSRFKDVRNGVEDCYRLYRNSATNFIVVRQDGTPSGTIDLIK